MTENQLKQISTILESANTEESILKNSSLIYISPYTNKHIDLESVIRFGDCPVEILQEESKKLQVLSNTFKHDTSITESTKVYVDKMNRLVDYKLSRNLLNPDGKLNIALEAYESAYVMPEYYNPVNETLSYSKLNGMKDLLEDLKQLDVITPKGVISVCESLFMTDDIDDYDDVKYELVRLMGNTVRNEMDNPNCRDLPMVKAAHKCEDYLVDEFDDDCEITDKIKDIFKQFEDSIEDEVEYFFDRLNHEINKIADSCCEEFNCNPYANIYTMTPFPVGARQVANTIDDCLNAETDEELLEALNQFAKLLTICESIGYDLITERSDSIVAKAARKLKKPADAVTKAARNVRDTAHDAKTAISKNTDAMARFIEQTYDTITKKDLDNRKKEIMAKGLKGKLKKILRWISVSITGLGAMAVGTAGGAPVVTILAAISLIGYISREGKLEANARNEIIRELENEIKICDEKIEDSRGDDKKQNKYELIRIRSKLENELNRIKYHKEY